MAKQAVYRVWRNGELSTVTSALDLARVYVREQIAWERRVGPSWGFGVSTWTITDGKGYPCRLENV